MTSLLADLRAQPDFRTELWSQPEAEPKSEVTQCLDAAGREEHLSYKSSVCMVDGGVAVPEGRCRCNLHVFQSSFVITIISLISCCKSRMI